LVKQASETGIRDHGRTRYLHVTLMELVDEVYTVYSYQSVTYACSAVQSFVREISTCSPAFHPARIQPLQLALLDLRGANVHVHPVTAPIFRAKLLWIS
jgi:hypothetical protein